MIAIENSRILCRRCEIDASHSTFTNFEKNSLKNHYFNRQCSDKSNRQYVDCNIRTIFSKIVSFLLLQIFFTFCVILSKFQKNVFSNLSILNIRMSIFSINYQTRLLFSMYFFVRLKILHFKI